jgi:hypothetical protein
MFVYQPVSQNISKENNSYRVRFSKNGKRYSKSFTSKKAAVEFRKKMVAKG